MGEEEIGAERRGRASGMVNEDGMDKVCGS